MIHIISHEENWFSTIYLHFLLFAGDLSFYEDVLMNLLAPIVLFFLIYTTTMQITNYDKSILLALKENILAIFYDELFNTKNNNVENRAVLSVCGTF